MSALPNFQSDRHVYNFYIFYTYNSFLSKKGSKVDERLRSPVPAKEAEAAACCPRGVAPTPNTELLVTRLCQMARAAIDFQSGAEGGGEGKVFEYKTVRKYVEIFGRDKILWAVCRMVAVQPDP